VTGERGAASRGVDRDGATFWELALGSVDQSLLSFTAGAFVPLAPSLIARGSTEFVLAMDLSLRLVGRFRLTPRTSERFAEFRFSPRRNDRGGELAYAVARTVVWLTADVRTRAARF